VKTDPHRHGRVGSAACASPAAATASAARANATKNASPCVHLDPGVARERLAQHAAVLREHVGVTLPELVQKARRTLDVREEQRDRSGRKLPHADMIAQRPQRAKELKTSRREHGVASTITARSWSDPMTEPERWQVSTEAAEVYESCFVPAIFGAWAGPVADAAGVRTGDRVLDVGCGTGVLAREALRRVGGEGQVVGVDLNEGMLAVAARTEPRIEWRQGDAASLPFEDASFDVVVSQFALMYFPDRTTSLSEMWRTLASGGRLAIAAWAPLGNAPGYQILVDVTTRLCGDEAADVLAAPFVLGDHTELAELAVESGILGADVTLHEGSIRFPSVKEFIRVEVQGSPLADIVSDDAMDRLASESEEALTEFVMPSGEIVIPMDAHIVTARKR
jgi:SAM-dependent methyltransferase